MCVLRRACRCSRTGALISRARWSVSSRYLLVHPSPPCKLICTPPNPPHKSIPPTYPHKLWTFSSEWDSEETFLFNQALGRTSWSWEEHKLMVTMQANGRSFEEWDAAVRGEEQRAMGVGKSPVAAALAFSLEQERTRVGRAEETTREDMEGGSEEAIATAMVKSPPGTVPVEDKTMAQRLPTTPCAWVEVDDEAYLDHPGDGDEEQDDRDVQAAGGGEESSAEEADGDGEETEEIEAEKAGGGCDSAHAGCDCEQVTECGGCGESYPGSEWVTMQAAPGICDRHPAWCGHCVDQACSLDEECSPRGGGGPTACSCGFSAENWDEQLAPCFGCYAICHSHCQGTSRACVRVGGRGGGARLCVFAFQNSGAPTEAGPDI
jgi:hypothetical protein